jgi:hypothetical protein
MRRRVSSSLRAMDRSLGARRWRGTGAPWRRTAGVSPDQRRSPGDGGAPLAGAAPPSRATARPEFPAAPAAASPQGGRNESARRPPDPHRPQETPRPRPVEWRPGAKADVRLGCGLIRLDPGRFGAPLWRPFLPCQIALGRLGQDRLACVAGRFFLPFPWEPMIIRSIELKLGGREGLQPI